MSESKLNVIDTFRIDTLGITRVQFHIQRTFEALLYFSGEKIDRRDLEKIYFSQTPSQTPRKGRFVFNPNTWREVTLETENLVAMVEPVRLELSSFRIQKSGLGPQNFKTSERDYWEKSLQNKSTTSDDVIGVNDLGQITETSRFNLFLKKENTLFTPSLRSGCLDGVYRKSLFASTAVSIQEKVFHPEDLDGYDIYVGNSLRGLLKATFQK